MKTQKLTDATTDAVLATARRILVEEGRSGASMSAMAKAAGVSRQTLYLAFGGRAGLLRALCDRAAEESENARLMAQLAAAPDGRPRGLIQFAWAWLSHLAEIYPIAIELSTAARTDRQAAGTLAASTLGAVHGQFLAILSAIAAKGLLRDGIPPERAADIAWSLTSPESWRELVVDRGWSAKAFATDRVETIRLRLLREE
ncbi:TetR/AcrR family transcriptional regulator [Albidovulum sp.]